MQLIVIPTKSSVRIALHDRELDVKNYLKSEGISHTGIGFILC